MPDVRCKTDAGNSLTLCQLCSRLKKRRGRAVVKASCTVKIHSSDKETPAVKIVFAKNRASGPDWTAILSTGTEASDEEILRVYGMR